MGNTQADSKKSFSRFTKSMLAFSHIGLAVEMVNAEPDITVVADLHAISHSFNENDRQYDVFLDGSVVEVSVPFSASLSLFTSVVWEPATEFPAEENNVFDGHGVFVQELLMDYRFDDFTVYAGKFNPAFGNVWNQTPGIFRKRLAGAYELVEKIGFGGSYNLAAGLNPVAVNISMFRQDVTELNHSLGNDRGHVDVDSGGVGNTDSLSSFAAALNGQVATEKGELSYHLAYSQLGKGSDSITRQKGGVMGLVHSADIGGPWSYLLTVETAYFNGWSGEDVDTHFFTAGAELFYGRFSAITVYSSQTVKGDSRRTDDFVELSLSYAINEEFKFYLGWADMDIEAADSRELGVRLHYEASF